jgi:hypothetical protein
MVEGISSVSCLMTGFGISSTIPIRIFVAAADDDEDNGNIPPLPYTEHSLEGIPVGPVQLL